MGLVGLKVLRIQLPQLVAKLLTALLKAIDLGKGAPKAVDRSIQGHGHILAGDLTIYDRRQHLESVADMPAGALTPIDGPTAGGGSPIVGDRHILTTTIAQASVDRVAPLRKPGLPLESTLSLHETNDTRWSRVWPDSGMTGGTRAPDRNLLLCGRPGGRGAAPRTLRVNPPSRTAP
jgi:hypothetical protein